MKKNLSAIVALLMICSLSAPAFAADRTWNGGGGDTNWGTVLNWGGTAPVGGDTLSFGGTIRLSNTNNIAADTNFASITFNNGAGAFTLAGNEITLAGNVTNNDDSLQTINLAMIMTNERTFSAASGNLAVGGVLSGVGGLIKTGTNTLTLSGTNTYTGLTTVSQGTLSLSGGSAIADAAAVTVSGGTLDVAASETVGAVTLSSGTISGVGILTGSSYSLTDSGAISAILAGTGTLTKTGTGTATLSGANTYTGKTSIQNGILSVSSINSVSGSASSLGMPTTIPNGTIDLGATTTTGQLTYTGTAVTSDRVINLAGTTGGGTLDQSGTGLLKFTSALTATSAGVKTLTLQGSTTGTGEISGAIVDGGGTTSVTKSGTGIWTLSGTNTYTGGTIISTGGGTLTVTNSSALGTGTVANNATLAVGTTNLTLGNTYTQNSGSSLDLTANSSSSFGKITSTGKAALVSASSTVNVTVGGYIPNNTNLTIIDTGSTGITGGAPTTVNTSESGNPVYSPRVSFTSSISGNNLILTADHTTTGFASLANNANAQAAGTVLDNVTNPSSDMTTVLNTLEFLSNAQTTSALNTMTPIVDAGIRDNSYAALNNFIGASLERSQSVLTAAAPGKSAKTGVSSGDESKLNGIWAKEYGSYLTQGTRQGIQGYDAWNTGTAVGLDRMFNDTLTLGVSGGYAYGNVDSDANNGRTNISSAQGAIYAGYQDANIPYFIDTVGSFAWNWYEGKRDINIGAINRTANADYDGQQYGAYLGGGYKFELGKSLELTPLASIQWNHLRLAGYTETDAGSMNLSVNRQSYDILQSGLGARIASPLKYKWGNFTPEVHAKWLYNFIGDDMAITSTYTGGGGSFTSNGAKPAKNGVNLGGKLSFDLKNDVSIIAECDTEMRDGFVGVYGSATLRYKF